MATHRSDQTSSAQNKTRDEKRRLSMESLARTISDISFNLGTQETLESHPPPQPFMVEDAKCECCGMCEECTPDYVKTVRRKFIGRMVCGLCSEAVKEEMDKNGGKRLDEALHAHVKECASFNRMGRAYPVLCQAEAMREILRKNKAKSVSPGDENCTTSGQDHKKLAAGPIITRSSSCIPSIYHGVKH